MTEQLKIQITQVSNKLEDIYGEHYSKQYDYAINDIQNKTSIATTHIIVDLLDLTINDNHKQQQINSLKKDVKNLQKENKELIEDNKILKERVVKLENNNDKLTKQINILEQNKQKFDALVKLHECNALVNKEFKRLYRIKFNKNKYDNNIPNIGDFINDPPTEDDKDNYIFWKDFNIKYPDSDNIRFRIIYQQIANHRADFGAHVKINRLNKTDFDKLIELVYPDEYNTNKELYEQYRDWLFMFPV